MYPLEEIVNKSLNYTFRRTMLTSISTGLPVFVMLFFGGEALQDFSLALLIGIFFGTYSSVYIASPIMMLLQPKQDKEISYMMTIIFISIYYLYLLKYIDELI